MISWRCALLLQGGIASDYGSALRVEGRLAWQHIPGPSACKADTPRACGCDGHFAVRHIWFCLFYCRSTQVLDFGLNHRNSAVVMATAKLFLHYTLAFPAQHQQVWAAAPNWPSVFRWFR